MSIWPADMYVLYTLYSTYLYSIEYIVYSIAYLVVQLGGGQRTRLEQFRHQFRHEALGGAGGHRGPGEGVECMGWTSIVTNFATGPGRPWSERSSQNFKREGETRHHLGSISDRFEIR
jgi:hypothetical protein